MKGTLHGIFIWAYIAASFAAGGFAVLGMPAALRLMTPDGSAEYDALLRDALPLLPMFFFCAATTISAVMLLRRHTYTLSTLKYVLFCGLWLMPLMSLAAYLRASADNPLLLNAFIVNLYTSVCLSCFAKKFVKTGIILTACCIASGLAAFGDMHKLCVAFMHGAAHVSLLIFAYLYYFAHAKHVRLILENASSSFFMPESGTG